MTACKAISALPRVFVQSRINQGKGPVRIRLDLEQRGIGDAVIEMAIEESAADWHGLARDVRVRKFGDAEPADFKAKAKQMRFLQYRGFEQDHSTASPRITLNPDAQTRRLARIDIHRVIPNDNNENDDEQRAAPGIPGFFP